MDKSPTASSSDKMFYMFSPPHLSKEKVEKLLSQENLFTKKVQLALRQAFQSHKNQKRTDGKEYLEEHIYPIVASVVSRYGKEKFIEDLLIVCILHDVLEDDPSVSKQEITRVFGEKIIEYVGWLTKAPEENAHGLPQEKKMEINKRVLERLRNAPSLVQKVKLEDRLNNISCIEKANTPKFERYLKETNELYIPFSKDTGNYTYIDLLNQQIQRLKN
jgi:GTP pyrophosphokinase/guanosine-3',5'-bis(diphosphate) 3'-pyrophosphohydrolase